MGLSETAYSHKRKRKLWLEMFRISLVFKWELKCCIKEQVASKKLSFFTEDTKVKDTNITTIYRDN